jgi:effector-binding domain-containing protein
MDGPNTYRVSLQRAAPRTIAAVHARLPLRRVPAEFKRYLDQVYAARSAGLQLDGQNIFVYRDAPGQAGDVDAEFGVGLRASFVAIGAVRPVDLPFGEVAATTHWGTYTKLGAAHDAVITWCRTHSHALAGPRWEVYGHYTGVEAEQRTDIYYLLAPRSRAETTVDT